MIDARESGDAIALQVERKGKLIDVAFARDWTESGGGLVLAKSPTLSGLAVSGDGVGL